jgi:membrane protease subunit (stomatin/prohibitin family)
VVIRFALDDKRGAAMSLWDRVKKQFIEVIEWTESDDEVLAWHFPIADNEIKNGAQLTVRPTQAALFIDQGQVADQFGAGRHPLTTENLPILTKLRSWSYGFDSPFKADVFFFSLRQKLARRWGTPGPITIRDRDFGSVQIRMFGTFSYHVADVAAFFREVSGTRDLYTAADLDQQLVSQINGGVASVFAASGVPFLDMAANQVQLAQAMQAQLASYAQKIGVAIDAFVVENVSVPPALQQALAQKQSMGIMGADLGKLAQYSSAMAIGDAARNQGPAGMGVGMAVGAGLAQVMQGSPGLMVQPQQGSAGNPQPAAPSPAMKACVGCGKGIDADAQFCRWCGKPQAATCGKCGAQQPGDAAFCSKCGNKIGA